MLRTSFTCTLVALPLAFATMVNHHRVLAQAASPPTSSPGGSAPRKGPVTPRVHQPGQSRGQTYDQLASRIKRATTKFTDGVAVTERGVDGTMRTSLFDQAGNERARLHTSRKPDGALRVKFDDIPGTTAHESVLPQDVVATPDWANEQIYARHADKHPGKTEWNHGLLRARGARGRSFEADTEEISVDFDNGVTSRATRRVVPRQGKRATWETSVLEHNLVVGMVMWSAEHKTLAWSFPGLSKGYLNEERLMDVGGWTFVPDMSWSTVQGLAFYEFHKKVKDGRTAAARPNLWDKFVDFWIPRVEANEPGCDYLHWLDGTVFRPCCDRHDICYQKNGCTSKSWFWGGQWACAACNAFAVSCFTSYFGPECDLMHLLVFGWCGL